MDGVLLTALTKNNSRGILFAVRVEVNRLTEHKNVLNKISRTFYALQFLRDLNVIRAIKTKKIMKNCFFLRLTWNNLRLGHQII